MQMKNKVKSEKGVMTMYVTIAVVTFTIILVALFSLAVATRRNQIKTLIKIKEVYEQDNNKKEQMYMEQKEKIELPSTSDTTPYYPDDTFRKDSSTDLDTGLVIKDRNKNEYVWIEVPRSLYANSSYNTKTTTADQKPTSSTDYEKIEYCLHKYTDYYRRDKNGTLTDYTDIYYSDATTGLTRTQYTDLKQKMLKSVYENGGFWIGRYEAGITTERTTSGTPTIAPLSKQGTTENPVYPYTYITCKQAQTLTSQLSTGKSYTSSLMFGVQWDLVMKHIEVKEVAKGTDLATIQNALRSNSKDLGNYSNASFTINRGEYAEYKSYALLTTWTPYNKTTSNNFVDSNSVKQVESSGGSGILLTTGASDECKKMNIYDLAGNVSEFTLEYTASTSHPCANRGSSFFYPSYMLPVSGRRNDATTAYRNTFGFRVSLFK